MIPKEIDWEAKASAVIIDDKRYWLHRKFQDGEGVCVFHMLNPSKADKKRNDPTTRMCIEFAQKWNYGAMVLVNLYAAISSHPDDLYEMDDAVGRRNNEFILAACSLVKDTKGAYVAAWGVHPLARLRGAQALATIRGAGVSVECIGITKEGQPRHPLWSPRNAELKPYGR